MSKEQSTKVKTSKVKEPLFDIDKEMKWYSGLINRYEHKVYTPELHLKVTTTGKHRSLSLE